MARTDTGGRKTRQRVAELEACVMESWRANNFDAAQFPGIAARALSQTIASGFGVDPVLDWLARSPSLCHQPRLDQTFGQPPLTLAWNGLFQLDMLFWSSAGTAIHGHGFVGAFTVLEGASLHFDYAFSEEKRLTDTFRLGRLQMLDCERLAPGSVRTIRAGSQAMHALIHLGRPSVSLVLRTCGDGLDRELVGFPPGVALSEAPRHPLRTRQLQVIEMLAATDPERALAMAEILLREADAQTAFQALTVLTDGGHLAGHSERLAAAAAQRHGSLVQTWGASIEWAQLQRRTDRLLRRVTESDSRTLLALLLYCRDREQLSACLARLCPEHREAELLDWFSGLAGLQPASGSFDALCLKRIAEWIRTGIPDGPPGGAGSALEDAVESFCLQLAHDPLYRPLFYLQSAAPSEARRERDLARDFQPQ